MTEFDNYIFDLYGTLIDIHTDEERPGLWEDMTKYLKKNFGANYKGPELGKRYLEICTEEEKALKKRINKEFPEIRIENVWIKLIQEKKGEDGGAIASKIKDNEDVSLDESTIRKLCIFFREASRDKFVVYDGVTDTLDRLKEMGKKIFLLSNAQEAFTRKELDDAGLTDYFDDIFISSDKEVKKPQKEFLSELIKEHSLNFDKCVMIGNDIFSDVGVAFKNGMHSVFLNTYSFTEKKIDKELTELGIKGSELMPVIVRDGDIRKILDM